MGALTLELRAVLALSQKLEADGRDDEGLELLEELTAQFESASGFPDLDQAQFQLRRLIQNAARRDQKV